jgi:hypothetical protein
MELPAVHTIQKHVPQQEEPMRALRGAYVLFFQQGRKMVGGNVSANVCRKSIAAEHTLAIHVL